MWFKSIKDAAAYAQVDGWTMSKKMETSGSFIDNNGDEYIRETPMKTKNKYKNTGKKLCKAITKKEHTSANNNLILCSGNCQCQFVI
jgi:hypothetical protein